MSEAAAHPLTEDRFAADREARRRAIDPERSLLVRAPAGSGKTGLLVQRFLRLLAGVDEPEAVLALTFTRKAAAEMRARVLQAMHAAGGSAPQDEHERQTWELAVSARRREAERGWTLLETPSRLKIMTIDGLALSLASRLPWLSRLGAPPQPSEDAAGLYQEAALGTLRRIEHGEAHGAEAARRLLGYLGADVTTAQRLLADLLERRDQWLPWLAEAVRDDGWRERLRGGLKNLVDAQTGAARRRLQTTGLKLPEAGDLASWRGLADAVLTNTGRQRKRGGPPGWSGNLTPEQCAALDRLRALPDPELSAGQWEMFETMIALLPAALAELRVVFAERRQCDFTEITLAAAQALANEDGQNTLAYALDARLQHLLVDEFQDTSRGQYALLRGLTAEWSAGDGRTLFAVGDAMQSIYGFRNADVGLFLQAAQRGRLGGVGLEVLELSRNFRSQAPLVLWCIHQFTAAVTPGAMVAFTAAQAGVARPADEGAAPAGVEVHVLPGHRHLTEAVRVRELVEAEQLAAPGEKIAILAMSRRHLAPILAELHRRGIAYQGLDLLPLNESPVVADLMALTRAIRDAADRIAWLAVLRAPWCGLKLGELHALCAGDRQATLMELWAQRGAGLAPQERARAERTLGIVAAAARRCGRMAMRPLVEWCWRELEGARLTARDVNPADAEAYFELMDELDARAEAGAYAPDELERETARLHSLPDPNADGQIQVMTVHKAKGLQFDTVIIPRLGGVPKLDDSRLLEWVERDPEFLIAPRPRAREKDRRFYEFIRDEQQQRRREEQLRQLYVAATRARRRLHLLAFNPTKRGTAAEAAPPDGRSPLARLWGTLEVEFRRQAAGLIDPEHIAALGEANATAGMAWKPPRLRRIAEVPEGAIDEAPESSAGAAPFALEPAGNLERQIGIAVHAMLQSMTGGGGVADEGEERLRLALLNAGVRRSELGPARVRARQALEGMLGDERGRWLLRDHAQGRCEWGVSGVVNGEVVHRVIDRSFVDEEGTRWIVDYKTAAPAQGETREAFLERQAESYRGQLEEYAALLGGMETRRLRYGLYFPLIAGWRELTG